MKPPAIPDVLFLRPQSEEGAGTALTDAPRSSEKRANTVSAPHRPSDVIFASASLNPTSLKPASTSPAENAVETANEPSLVPNPHTRFSAKPILETESGLFIDSELVAQHDSTQKPKSQFGGKVQPVPKAKPPIQSPAITRASVEPSWMVNQFQWSPITDQLIETNADDLARLIQEIQLASAPHTVIGVMGLKERVGTTSVAQLCTRLIDEAQHRQPISSFAEPIPPTLLIDANFYHPAIGDQIGLRCRRCWADLQEHRDALGDAVIANSVNRIHVMPMNCSIQEDELDRSAIQRPNMRAGYTIPASGLDGIVKRLNNVITDAKVEYGRIIVDLGTTEAWQSRTGFPAIAKQCDQILLVDQSPIDRRQFSQVYWDLTDSGISEVHLLETPSLED